MVLPIWLAQALEADGVPRRGVSADAKASFAQACLGPGQSFDKFFLKFGWPRR